jgi:hypothetical protein
VMRPVHLDQLPSAGLALPPLPMLLAPPLRRPLLLPNQPPPQRLMVDLQPFVLA